NDSRVIPVRIIGSKQDTSAKIELLLLQEEEEDVWEAMVKPAKKVKPGTEIIFVEGQLKANSIEERTDGTGLVKQQYKGIFLEVLNEHGEMPLPTYIKKQLGNQERYQTVYAKEEGSAAAPTAGLHFTPELLETLKQKGVHLVYVTLHVGLG